MLQTRRRSMKKAGQTPETFLFRIDSIAPDYSFGLNHSRFEPGGYSEHAHTNITGTCLAPTKVAGRDTTFTLIGDRRITADLVEPANRERPPNGVGTLTMRGQQSEYLGAIPFDALASVAGLILANGLRFIELSGPPLQRGSSRITYMSFKKDADPDDY